MKQSALQLRAGHLVSAYYIIQETRKQMDLREQAMCRDEIILVGDQKKIGRIVDEGEKVVTMIPATMKKEVEVKRAKILKIIHRKFDEVEEARKQIFRFPIGKREADVSSIPLFQMEKDIKHECQGLIKDWPVWNDWLKDVRGVGPIITAGLMAFIDINIATSPSKLWHYAGHHVTAEGKLPRLEKGKKRTWNRRLQTIVWNAGESFVRSGDGYRALYDRFKEDEISKRVHSVKADPEDLAGEILAESLGGKEAGFKIVNKSSAVALLKKIKGRDRILVERTPGHIDRRARRRMRKVFLGHLWTVWRQKEGLSIRPVYIVMEDPDKHENIPVILK
jgi:hypothetical protein